MTNQHWLSPAALIEVNIQRLIEPQQLTEITLGTERDILTLKKNSLHTMGTRMLQIIAYIDE